jgi:hypothetical protein
MHVAELHPSTTHLFELSQPPLRRASRFPGCYASKDVSKKMSAGVPADFIYLNSKKGVQYFVFAAGSQPLTLYQPRGDNLFASRLLFGLASGEGFSSADARRHYTCTGLVQLLVSTCTDRIRRARHSPTIHPHEPGVSD